MISYFFIIKLENKIPRWPKQKLPKSKIQSFILLFKISNVKIFFKINKQPNLVKIRAR